MSRLIFTLTFLTSSFAIGCSGGGGSKVEKPAAVNGRVTLDSQPLASGRITFDKGNGAVPAVLEIVDGAYSGNALPGSNAVRIVAMKMVPMPKNGMTGPLYDNKQIEQNYLPDRYSIGSKEVRDVKVGGPNEFDFAVTSK